MKGKAKTLSIREVKKNIYKKKLKNYSINIKGPERVCGVAVKIPF